MDLRDIRESSLRIAQQLGCPINSRLPLLDPITTMTSSELLLDRMLVLYVCVACSYGYPKDRALVWLNREGLSACLEPSEIEYLQGKAENRRSEFQWRVEALWALAWASGHHDSLDFSDSCSDSFVEIFPDLKAGSDASEFRRFAKLRDAVAISSALDLAYCLHWAVRDAELNGKPVPGRVPGQVVQQRRHALEWVVYDGNWDEVSLDT